MNQTFFHIFPLKIQLSHCASDAFFQDFKVCILYMHLHDELEEERGMKATPLCRFLAVPAKSGRSSVFVLKVKDPLIGNMVS